MPADKPLISVILPAYNEEALLVDHSRQVIAYLESIDSRYDWELLIVNDGSRDRTGELAQQMAENHPKVRALQHPTNFGLGQTLKFGFANTHGDYIVTLDIDLSYDVQHIEEMVDLLRERHAKIVLASPYMEGGSIANVPWLRRTLSIWGNRFLSFFARGKFSTLTSLVRAYDGPFIRSLDLRSMGMDIMPETLYKAMVVRARIEEAPARLDWGPQNQHQGRVSSMRLMVHVLSTVASGFLFRPVFFFILPGLVLLLFALYVDVWMFIHFFEELAKSAPGESPTVAFARAYAAYPHTYVIGLLATMLAVQLIGLGALAKQSTRYFEDLYHMGSWGLRGLRRPIETPRSELDPELNPDLRPHESDTQLDLNRSH